MTASVPFFVKPEIVPEILIHYRVKIGDICALF